MSSISAEIFIIMKLLFDARTSTKALKISKFCDIINKQKFVGEQYDGQTICLGNSRIFVERCHVSNPKTFFASSETNI